MLMSIISSRSLRMRTLHSQGPALLSMTGDAGWEPITGRLKRIRSESSELYRFKGYGGKYEKERERKAHEEGVISGARAHHGGRPVSMRIEGRKYSVSFSRSRPDSFRKFFVKETMLSFA